jgi:hypothetical protein
MSDNVSRFPMPPSKGPLPQRASAPYGGGDGGDGMLEARIARLEKDSAEILSDLKSARNDLSELKGKVSMLPGYPGIALIMTVIGGALAVINKYLPAISP